MSLVSLLVGSHSNIDHNLFTKRKNSTDNQSVSPQKRPRLESPQPDIPNIEQIPVLVKSTKHHVRSPKHKHIPQDESPQLRDRRTIFLGNLPLQVLSKKSLKKQLQTHILSFIPTAKVESIRFRSIPFQKPTTKLPDQPDTKSSKISSRSSDWRAKQAGERSNTEKTDEKKFLTPAQKKKIAYINQEFHSTADVVNAYIVFAHPQLPTDRPANLPPLPPSMDPYQAALQAAVKANGSLFMDRVLRVDLVGKPKSKTKASEDELISIQEPNPRLSIFIGNLDFASKEEDLRAFFEGLMSKERGSPASNEETSNSTKPVTWVTRVRVLRDSATQLGKGFAFVEFMDKQCVDEVLVMDESKLKFAKRKLRIQRCKTVPGTGIKHSTPQNTLSGKTFPSEKSGPNPVRDKQVDPVPKGDPSLGEELAGLSKEERKQRKSAHPGRVARRLAKKKQRMAMRPTVRKDLKERLRVRAKVKKT